VIGAQPRIGQRHHRKVAAHVRLDAQRAGVAVARGQVALVGGLERARVGALDGRGQQLDALLGAPDPAGANADADEPERDPQPDERARAPLVPRRRDRIGLDGGDQLALPARLFFVLAAVAADELIGDGAEIDAFGRRRRRSHLRSG
jgi:hypothetical protein